MSIRGLAQGYCPVENRIKKESNIVSYNNKANKMAERNLSKTRIGVVTSNKMDKDHHCCC